MFIVEADYITLVGNIPNVNWLSFHFLLHMKSDIVLLFAFYLLFILRWQSLLAWNRLNWICHSVHIVPVRGFRCLTQVFADSQDTPIKVWIEQVLARHTHSHHIPDLAFHNRMVPKLFLSCGCFCKYMSTVFHCIVLIYIFELKWDLF